MSDLHLLPYLRRGLVRHLSAADPGAGPIGPGRVPLALDVAGHLVDETARLLAPHHVAALGPAAISRRYPVPGATEVESNYFPLIELAAPDLPWRYTPAAPGARGRLRPWLALVVVEADAPGIEYTAVGGGGGRLAVDATAIDQLPPADELWAWAHVQSSRPVGAVETAAVEAPETLLARLICPRRLDPGRRYRAALVNAFAPGTGERSQPAWSASSAGAVQLTVFDTWTFTTAEEAGDFESLCERLEPAADGGELGVRPIDVTEPGIEIGWRKPPVVIDLVGALADVDLVPGPAPAGNPLFAAAVEPILDATLSRAEDEVPAAADYDPLRDDPVLGLPFYGSWPAAAASVPAAGWARDLNVRSDRRVASGLGARIVRENQESLMAAAWDQLGSVREVADELNRGRLSAEVGRTWQARIAAVEDGDRVGLAAPLLSYLRVGDEPARRVAARSVTPDGAIDRAFLRRTPRARGASAATAYWQAARPTATADALAAVAFRAVATPVGIHAIELELVAAADERPTAVLGGRDVIDHVTAVGLADRVDGGGKLADFIATGPTATPTGVPKRPTRRSPGGRRRSTQRPRAETAAGADVASAVAAIDPLSDVRAALLARIPALEELLPAGELPAELGLAPAFLDALFWKLAALDRDVIVPGLGEFPDNRVRLLAVNAGFVGALMVGANHEMARELLWREYPADLAATFFQRFFDYADQDTVDFEPIADWPPTSSIADNLPGAAASTAILIRAELVRRYPDVNVFLAPQDSEGGPDYARSLQPSFEGRLGEDVLVVGFALAPEVVLGETAEPEHFLVLEERMTAPRFGLDLDRQGALETWDELAWTDFEAAGTHIGAGRIAGLGKPTFDGVEWGRNAAHLAAAVHQRPFRRLYPATHLVQR